MTFPQKVDKYEDETLLTAVDLLAWRQQTGTAPNFTPPRAIIFCFQSALLRYAVKKYGGKKAGGFFAELYLLKKTGGQVGVAGNFGLGAPVVAVLVEDFAAFGVRQFITIGLAGGLQETLQAGDLVVGARAIRDEGTSHHYLPAARYATAAATLTQQLQAALAAGGHAVIVGTSWTTDAPYRETRGEVAQYQQEGVQTAEMEAAALFTVGHALNVETAATFAIGDTLSGGQWQLDFDARRSQRGLEILLDAAVESLQAS